MRFKRTFARKGRCATAPHFLAAFYIDERLYLHFEGIMADKYRMIPHGSGGFIVNHNTAGIVGVFKTETEAQQEMKDCERDDFLLQTARKLIEKAVQTHMRMHHIDRQAAHDWIREAVA